MICFGAKTDQEEREKMDMWVPLKKIKKIKIKIKRGRRGERASDRVFDLLFLFFIFSRFFFYIWASDRRNSLG